MPASSSVVRASIARARVCSRVSDSVMAGRYLLMTGRDAGA